MFSVERSSAIKTEIVVSIIVTLLCTYIISPIINIFPLFGITTVRSFYDSIFHMAGRNTNNTLIIYIFCMLIGLFTGTVNATILMKLSKRELTDQTKKNSAMILSKGIIRIIRSDHMTKVMIVLILVFLVFTVAYIVVPCTLKDSFDISITRIVPYTDAKTIDMLKSDWVRMKTKADFDKIKKQMDDIVNINDVGD